MNYALKAFSWRHYARRDLLRSFDLVFDPTCSYAMRSQALRKVHVADKRMNLDEETRWQVVGEAVEELRRYGGWKWLDEEAPLRPLAPSSGAHDKRENLKAKPEK